MMPQSVLLKDTDISKGFPANSTDEEQNVIMLDSVFFKYDFGPKRLLADDTFEALFSGSKLGFWLKLRIICIEYL
jgi:hypothetical protein